MISVWHAYTRGLSESYKNGRLILFLFFTNILTGYLMTMPVSMLLSNALNRKTASDVLLSHFDITLFKTIVTEYGAGLDLFTVITTFGLFYLVLNIFLAGGILDLISGRNSFRLAAFIQGCLKYVTRFFILFLYAILFCILTVIFFILLRSIFNRITADVQTEFWPVILIFLGLFIVGIMFTLISMILDYTRILIVNNEYLKVFRTLRRSFLFIMQHKINTVSIFLLYFSTLVVVSILYLFIESQFVVNSLTSMALFILITQIFIFFRIGLRFALLYAQFWYYRHSDMFLLTEDRNPEYRTTTE